MAIIDNPFSRARTYFENSVVPWVCNLPEEYGEKFIPLLLGGIFLSLRELIEAAGQGGQYFRITPFNLEAQTPVKVVDKEVNGRARRIVVWCDSAVGMPDPSLRVGTSRGGAGNGGVLVSPGMPNEIGKVPAGTELWMSSDIALKIYVIEEA